MKQQNLMTGNILAVIFIAAVVCVGIVSGASVIKQFISVDPIGDMNTGDSGIITGTTSLPAGSSILVEVYPASLETGSGMTTDPETGTVYGIFSGATGIVKVVKGPGNSNTWSLPLETTSFQPGEYTVTVDSLSDDISQGDFTKGDITGATRFDLLQNSAPESAGGQFILIDSVGDKNTGDKFTITGTTNLAAGTKVLLQIYAASYEMDNVRSGNGEFTGAVGIVNVTRSTGDVNIWSMDLDTTTFHPREYFVKASLFTGNVQKGDFTTGNPAGTTKFVLK